MNTKKNKYQNSTSRISTSNYCNNNKEQIKNDNNPNNISNHTQSKNLFYI